MKLSEVQVRDKVPTGAPSDYTARLKSEPGSNAMNGWDLSYEAGMVTATKLLEKLLIPVGNVAYMKPEPPPAKVEKVKAA